MTNKFALYLATALIALAGFAVASPAKAAQQDDGGFGSGEMTSSSYSAFGDPNTFDPSAIEPAAGDEENAATTTEEQGTANTDETDGQITPQQDTSESTAQ